MTGWIIIEGTLYYFIFEMKIITEKLESHSLKEYSERLKRIKILRALNIGCLFLIYSPIVNASFIISTTLDNSESYKTLILTLLVIRGIALAITELYMYFTFFKLLGYFIQKKRQIV